MKIKAVNGTEVTLVTDDKGNELYFPNPAKEETKMGNWDDLFGPAKAKIMRANYLSHSKNGYKDSEGNKVRNIRDLEGTIIRSMELKDESDKPTSTKSPASNISLADAVHVYQELKKLKNPALATAEELQMKIIRQLINPALLEADIETLQFIIDLKKAEAKEAEKAETSEKK